MDEIKDPLLVDIVIQVPRDREDKDRLVQRCNADTPGLAMGALFALIEDIAEDIHLTMDEVFETYWKSKDTEDFIIKHIKDIPPDNS